MPDYKITIYLKTGPPKTGIRWHPSWDLDQVKYIVWAKVKKTIGLFPVERIEVEQVSTGDDSPNKGFEA